MEQTFEQYRLELERAIQGAYSTTPTVEEAEHLAARFLGAMIRVGEEYRTASLDARMRKAGAKAVKAAVYMEAATKDPKKPSDVMLQAIVDMSELAMGEQKGCDEAEVNAAELGNLLSVCREAHIYFRGLSKGKYE